MLEEIQAITHTACTTIELLSQDEFYYHCREVLSILKRDDPIAFDILRLDILDPAELQDRDIRTISKALRQEKKRRQPRKDIQRRRSTRIASLKKK